MRFAPEMTQKTDDIFYKHSWNEFCNVGRSVLISCTGLCIRIKMPQIKITNNIKGLSPPPIFSTHFSRELKSMCITLWKLLHLKEFFLESCDHLWFFFYPPGLYHTMKREKDLMFNNALKRKVSFQWAPFHCSVERISRQKFWQREDVI